MQLPQQCPICGTSAVDQHRVSESGCVCIYCNCHLLFVVKEANLVTVVSQMDAMNHIRLDRLNWMVSDFRLSDAVVLDMSDMSFLSSTAIGRLVLLGNRIRETGRVMRLVVGSRSSGIREILRALNVCKKCELLSSVGDALASL